MNRTRCRVRIPGVGFAALITVSMSLAGAPPAHAQEDTSTIITERPSFSASPVTLTANRVQIETGYQYTDDVATLDTFPNLLLRYGLAPSWELQLGWAGENRVDLGGATVRGASDTSIGVKHALTEADADTALALFAGASLPTGNRRFSSGSVDPALGLFWSHSGEQSWFGTVLLNESDGDLALSNGLGLAFSVGPRTGAYLEYVARFPDDGGPAHVLNGGLSFTPRPNIQWDVYGGTGLNDRAADWFVGAGFAIRL